MSDENKFGVFSFPFVATVQTSQPNKAGTKQSACDRGMESFLFVIYHVWF